MTHSLLLALSALALSLTSVGAMDSDDTRCKGRFYDETRMLRLDCYDKDDVLHTTDERYFRFRLDAVSYTKQCGSIITAAEKLRWKLPAGLKDSMIITC